MPVIKSVWNCKRSTLVQVIILWQIRLGEWCWNIVMKMLKKNKFNTRTCFLWLQDTIYPKKYAHGFVVLCFVVVMQSFIINSHEVFIHIHQGCFAGTGAIVRLPQCQWSKPDGYGKISQCITTTKHSKAKTVCIFLGIYCRLGLSETHTPVSNRELIHKSSWAEMVTCLKFDCFVLYLKFTKKYQLSFRDASFIQRSISSTLNLMQTYSYPTQRHRGFHFIRVGSCDEAETLLIKTLCWTRQIS